MRKHLVLFSILSLLLPASASADKVCVTYGPADDMLCAVNGDNGPSWYVFTGCEDILTIDPPETERTVAALSASVSGRYIAIFSAGEGHPMLAVFRSDRLDYGEAPELVRRFNPYPGTISEGVWDKETLQFESDADFAAGSYQTADQLIRYRFNADTGQLSRSP